jgi:hypothetical protein
MKILAKINTDSARYALIDLPDAAAQDKIRTLLSKNRHSKAIAEALARCDSFIKIGEKERGNVEAHLIITEESAHWDLTVGEK